VVLWANNHTEASLPFNIQGGSNMTGTDLCVNKPHSVPVIFEPPCISACLSLAAPRLAGKYSVYISVYNTIQVLHHKMFRNNDTCTEPKTKKKKKKLNIYLQ